jgi:hypothetical protein
VQRHKLFARSHVIADALNEFGRSGGFDRILDVMMAAPRGIHSVPLEHLVSLTRFLHRTQPLWHRQFAVKYMDRLAEAALASLCYVNREATDANKNQVVLGPLQAEGFDASVLETMIDQQVEPTWRRVYTLEMVTETQCRYRLGIGASLLCLANLKKRIQGIKYINEAIRSVRGAYQPHRGLTSKQLIAALRELGVMGHIFGENTHY